MSVNSFDLSSGDDAQAISLNIWDKPSFVTTSGLPRSQLPEAGGNEPVKHTEKRKPAATQSSIQEEDSLHHKSVKPSAPEERRKPGRKMDQKEPANKRKAQNRAAQRAFRERKERHLLELEEKVDALEQETTVAHNENEFLRFQVKRLQNELKMYREKTKQIGLVPSSNVHTSESGSDLESGNKKSSPASVDNFTDSLPSNLGFTFEFPFYSDKDSSKSDNFHKSSASSISSTSTNTKPSPASDYSNDHKLDVPSTASSLSGLEDADEEREFCNELSQACGTLSQPNRSKPLVNDNNRITGFTNPTNNNNPSYNNETVTESEISLLDSLTKPMVNPIPATANNYLSDGYDSNNFNSNLFNFDNLDGIDFNLYRDQAFETEDFTLPELINDEGNNKSSSSDLFGELDHNGGDDVFGSSNIGSVATTADSLFNTSPKDLVIKPQEPVCNEFDYMGHDLVVPNTNKNLLNCSAVWDRITSHPKYNDIDIDGLCDELKQKAKCSEFGIVLAENDLDNALFST